MLRALLGTRSFRREMLLQATLLSGVLAAGGVMATTGIVPPVFHAFLYLTGIPDPMCGMRTGTLALMRGDLHNALEANPLSLFFTPVSVAVVVDRLSRFRSGRPARRWSAREKRLLWLGVALILPAAWVYQLFRFDIL